MPPDRLRLRGSDDLVELWRALPVSTLSFPAFELASVPDPVSMSNHLRAKAWREFCLRPGASCVERQRSCGVAGRALCRADRLFPMHLGGGAPLWRTATLLPRWLPSQGRLELLALGTEGPATLAWARGALRDLYGLKTRQAARSLFFSDLELRSERLWKVQLATPWLLAKNVGAAAASADRAAIRRELSKSLRVRAHKFTALCASETQLQKFAAHLMHHIADALLPDAMQIVDADLRGVGRTSSSAGNGQSFYEVAWTGSFTIDAAEPLLPWLTVMSLAGLGENTDKGFGAVEISAASTHGVQRERIAAQ